VTGVLVESALRSMALGAAVGFGLWICRTRHARVRMAAWTLALAAAVLMPLLMQWRTVEIPAPRHVIERTPLVLQTVGGAASLPIMRVSTAPHSDWREIVFASWAAIAALLLLRVLAGFLRTWHVWRRGRPVRELLASGINARETDAIAAPATFGSGILLPEDWRDWDERKLSAALAHERAHVAWGDFWVQLLARLHAAIFWFSPLSWWLQNRLTVLGEAAADDAALQAIDDGPGYAEILLWFAARPQHASAAVAMARPRTVIQRVERILAGAGVPQSAGWPSYAATAAAVALITALAAGISTRAQTNQPPSPAHKQNTWSWTGDAKRDPWVIVSGDSVTMSGSTSDVDRARSYQDRIHGDYIWFSRNGKTYLITDPAAVKRARALFAPQEELGRKQAELGEKQARLGEQQARLGEKQAGVRVRMPAMDREVRDLRMQMESLQRDFSQHQAAALADGNRQLQALEKELREAKDQDVSQDRLSELQSELSEAQSKLSGDFQEHMSELQSRMGALQGEMGELQSRAGEEQSKLGEAQSELGEQQSKLGEEQSKLGEEQSRLAEEASRQLEKMLDDALRSGLAQPAR